MLVKHFNRSTTSGENIAEMDKLGYRPATHLEAYAFAKANPELQCEFLIVALGSSAKDDDHRFVTLLDGNYRCRILGSDLYNESWNSYIRFLFVRKDNHVQQEQSDHLIVQTDREVLTLSLLIKACRAFIEVLEWKD